jgi:homopolymeric O-antigen transport system permease protein
VIWTFVSTVINDGCQTFLSARNIITQVRMPYTIHACRTVCRNLIILSHNMVVVPLVLMIFSVPVGWTVVFILPALVILAINGIWISILLGMISARYRDVPPIVMNFVQVMFFLTPIFWPQKRLEFGCMRCRSIRCLLPSTWCGRHSSAKHHSRIHGQYC